jgi:UDP:flavonoid glycosyltransferase YjiC (YdhE family)
MQVTLIASGSRGDVQPYVALGHGLRQAGHSVRVLAPQDFEELIRAYGLEFHDVGGSTELIAQSMQDLIERGQILKIFARMSQAAEQFANQAARSGLAACAGADLIVAGLGGLFVGQALSEKLGLPLVQAHLLPLTPTRAFPGVLMPPLRVRLPGWANTLSHRITRQMVWQMSRSTDNKARAEVLQLPRAPMWGPYAALEQSRYPILHGYSPQVLAPPPDWPANIQVTGYWFSEAPPGWTPPEALVRFLEAGPPPIYIGFGSMPSRRPEATAEMVLQALAQCGHRGVLSAGWGGLKQSELPANVVMVRSVPHDWLFPQMAAVVHHGGVGTTAAGLRAGVPTVVTPFFADQPFWGQRVLALGVGPKPIPRRQLTAVRLAEAIRQAVTDAAMQARAAALGERIRAEDGIGRAMAAIEQARAGQLAPTAAPARA